MTSSREAREFADAVMLMIAEDQHTGQVPAGVLSLDELDNTVDVKDYFRQAGLPFEGHEAAELRAAVTQEVEQRLRAAHGGPWHVVWKRPGGSTTDIGRTAGYATQEEAEAVGRAHVRAEGGAWRLSRTGG